MINMRSYEWTSLSIAAIHHKFRPVLVQEGATFVLVVLHQQL
jgi:hypothetical protein